MFIAYQMKKDKLTSFKIAKKDDAEQIEELEALKKFNPENFAIDFDNFEKIYDAVKVKVESDGKVVWYF